MNYDVHLDKNLFEIISESLIESHTDEIGKYERSVSKDLYTNCNCIAFYENDIQIAYYIFVIARHPHYDKIIFQDVSYFINKDFRLKHAREIFNTVEKVAKELDCDIIINHCKTKSQINFFEKNGFKLSDYILTKEIQ